MSNNRWISHCKNFSTATGTKYRDALQHPHCQQLYREGGCLSANEIRNWFVGLSSAAPSVSSEISNEERIQRRREERRIKNTQELGQLSRDLKRSGKSKSQKTGKDVVM